MLFFASATGWTSYLPAVLQQVQVYWIMAICIATVAMLQTIPDGLRRPWVIQLITLTVALFFSFWMVGFNVYAFGIGLISSALSTSFFDIVFSALTSRVRAFFGVSSPDPTLSVSRPTNPENVSSNP